MSQLIVERAGVRLAVQEQGEGTPVVLLHGLTATHRYVVMGSRALERSGHRVISYDARGHGRSSPAPEPEAYTYDDLGRDALAVLDAAGIQTAVLAGASMGAHTLLWLALHAPERVGALVLITPAYDPGTNADAERLERWDALADGLRTGGIDGFLAAGGASRVPLEWKESVIRVTRQRLALHEHPLAVADALNAVPRSRPFGSLAQLAAVGIPVTVVASDDGPDPGHPKAIGEAYAAAMPGARLVTDQPGHSPVAWQGSQLSKVISDVAARVQAA